MTMTKRTSAGIEPLKTSIRIWWRIDGKRERETLHNTPPTPENLKKARDTADMIALQLKMGVFNRETVFPNSLRQPKAYFDYYIALFKTNHQNNVCPTTWNTYLSKISHHIQPYWGHQPIAKIEAEHVEYWVHQVLQKALSPKTIRDMIMLFHGIWTYWARKQKNVSDPTQYIKISKRDTDDINPFTRSEIQTIIERETDLFYKNLWTVMLWSGLSSHELLSLAKEDIDLEGGFIFVNRGFVKGLHRATKNRRRKRQIEVLPIVTEALRQHIHLIANQPSQRVIVLERDNKTEKTYTLTWLWKHPNSIMHLNYTQLERRWRTHLSNCLVDYRPPNNCRHTYASQILSSGAVTAEWLANQLGHTSTDMIHKHYGKFIPKDAKHIMSRLEQALNFR